MKNIIKLMLLPAMVLPLMLTSCDEDRDDNPTFDFSHVAEPFVLNTPANAANNTYDLASAESLELTCTQPNYGTGVPYWVRYAVQVSIDPSFGTDSTANYTELNTKYNTAKMDVNAAELNSAVVSLYQEANPDSANVPVLPIYIRLRAYLADNADTVAVAKSQTYSNVITLPSVKATYVAPDATYPNQLYVVGSSIQQPWTSWKPVAPVYGNDGQYFTMIYVPAGGSFKWGTEQNDWRGYDRLTSVTDQANAGVSDTDGDNHNIGIANAGWYTLLFNATISADGKSISYALTIYPAAAYVIGAGAGGNWDDANEAWRMTAPADASGNWESPAFTAGGELRAYIKVPGIDWWKTEFTLYKGALYWRNVDIPNNWASNVGSDYSVAVSAGQKLYVNFDANTGEVK